jgi:hypothetical protein
MSPTGNDFMDVAAQMQCVQHLLKLDADAWEEVSMHSCTHDVEPSHLSLLMKPSPLSPLMKPSPLSPLIKPSHLHHVEAYTHAPLKCTFHSTTLVHVPLSYAGARSSQPC